MKKFFQKNKTHLFIIVLFSVFIFLSYSYKLDKGVQIFEGHFLPFIKQMVFFLPFMFLLIGLGDVWIKKEKVEKHIGNNSGVKGAVIVLLLSMAQAGPLYGAFPVVYLLWKKGAGIRNLFLYIGGFCTLKIPMLAFESGFLGFKFTILRTLITLPILIIIAIVMDKYLSKKDFKVFDGA